MAQIKAYLVQVVNLQKATSYHNHCKYPGLKVNKLIRPFKCKLQSDSHCFDTHNLYMQN